MLEGDSDTLRNVLGYLGSDLAVWLLLCPKSYLYVRSMPDYVPTVCISSQLQI